MAYVIDANCFIEPYQRYYGFDICPGFWDWIDHQNNAKVAYSIDRVAGELTRVKDDLCDWANNKDSSFFLPMDSATMSNYAQIVNWVNSADFTQKAKTEFMKGADPFLVAYAYTYGHTVVTHETYEKERKNKVKIPNVCTEFKVPWMQLHTFLRTTGARFRV